MLAVLRILYSTFLLRAYFYISSYFCGGPWKILSRGEIFLSLEMPCFSLEFLKMMLETASSILVLCLVQRTALSMDGSW